MAEYRILMVRTNLILPYYKRLLLIGPDIIFLVVVLPMDLPLPNYRYCTEQNHHLVIPHDSPRLYNN